MERRHQDGRDQDQLRAQTDQRDEATTGKNRIMIFGPKSDGTYVIEFRTAAGESLAISIPGTEAAVIRHFQERMPYGLFVPDVDSGVE
jgi:hypothetical protein